MIDKKGALGEAVQMMPRLVIVSLVALVVLGGSTILYSHHVTIRTAEAMLMTRQVVDCIAPAGVVDISLYRENKRIFSICKIDGGKMDRFFVNLSIRDSSGNEVLRLSDGDSGSLWIEELFEEAKKESLYGIKVSKPGIFRSPEPYDILFPDKTPGKIYTEVLVKDER